MPTKRSRIPRNPLARVTPEALAAWIAGDRLALHRALRLKPWEHSPLDTFAECGARIEVRPSWLAQVRWDAAIAWRKALEAAQANAN